MRYRTSKSGVKLFLDFRDNLIIDRYDPEFIRMRGSKLRWMSSENSEDAVTWNVFRSLRQVDPQLWFPRLFEGAFPKHQVEDARVVTIDLWKRLSPPVSLRLMVEEGQSEIDVIIETESLVWFLEAKYKSDISKRTKHGPDREQIIRNIDVGSWFAGRRKFYFSLLILDEFHTPVGKSLIESYTQSPDSIIARLSHREDKIGNLCGVGLLTWPQVLRVMAFCEGVAARLDEKRFLAHAIEWMRAKGITPAAS